MLCTVQDGLLYFRGDTVLTRAQVDGLTGLGGVPESMSVVGGTSEVGGGTDDSAVAAVIADVGRREEDTTATYGVIRR